MNKWIAEFELEDGDTMPEHMDLEYKGVRIDFHCKPQNQDPCSTCGYEEGSIYCKEHCPHEAEIEQEPCGDAISRQDVLDLAKKGVLISNGSYKSVCKAINEVPSAEPKTGHWIEKDGFDGDVYYDCSECGESWTTIEGTPWDNEFKYCPNCGCRMIEPQESEEQE